MISGGCFVTIVAVRRSPGFSLLGSTSLPPTRTTTFLVLSSWTVNFFSSFVWRSRTTTTPAVL